MSKTKVTDASPSESRRDARDSQNLPLKDIVKLYKKAILWSLAISLSPIMEGYDVVLLGSFFGLTPFIEKYGTVDASGQAVLSAAWQSGINRGALAGCIVGLYLNSLVADRIGYKMTLIGSSMLMCGFIFLTFFAQNIITIEAGAVLIGIPWGVFQILPLTYIAEVIPVRLRGHMTTFINLCFVTGQLVGSGVVKAFSSRTDQWSYRLPLAIQWAWPLPVIVFTLLAPDSPWWLVRRGRVEDAKKSLRRLTSSTCGVPIDIDFEISVIQATNDQELSLDTGTSYFDCFKGTNLRRTEIVSVAWLAQTLCGFGLVSYSVVFLERAGVSESNSFSFTLGISGLGWIGTVVSWYLLDHYGRRTLYLSGLTGMFTVLLAIGILGACQQTTNVSWAIGCLLLVLALVYDLSIGPVCFAIVSEIPSTRLKIKSLAIARNIYNIGFIITNILVPRMVSSASWSWGAKCAFFWAGMCALLFIWTFIRLPETSGRNFAQIDLLFEKNIKARDFATTDTTQFSLEMVAGMKGLHYESAEHVERV